jgi:peptide-methionine (S)-S-oxide reductase
MTRTRIPLALGALLLAACAGSTDLNAADAKSNAQTAPTSGLPATAIEGERGVAVFAGGCFWCVESAFDELDGVFSAESGYTGAAKKNPGYNEVAAGKTGHAEAVRVVFDPAKISYEKLVEIFWHNIDPFQANAQFCDSGSQYRSELFFSGEQQRAVAEKSLQAIQKQFDRPVVTKITEAGTFWLAEEYHQDFHRKNPARYFSYRLGCGRDKRLREIWGVSPH